MPIPRTLQAWWITGTCTGAVLFGSTFLGLPLNSYHLAQVQALNRELGKLCTDPPRQAVSVCRIHARLVSAL
ncbi:MAG: hypothetical protein VKO65_02455 [Cyanobacteriota bacterium]|nr:hypothetical protein [Cyanobacteriota bacterium]